MTERSQNFTMYSGDFQEVPFTVTGFASIAGFTARWQAVDSSGAVVLNKETGSGIVIVDPIVTVTLDSVDTDELYGTFNHELELTSGTHKFTVAVGCMTIREDLIP